MTAVPAPTETPVTEPEPAPSIVETEQPDARPEGGVTEQAPESGTSGDAEDVTSFFRRTLGEASPEEISTFLDALPEDKRDKALSEYTRRAEQRAETRAREETEAYQRRQQEDDHLLQQSQQAEQVFSNRYRDAVDAFSRLGTALKEIEDDGTRQTIQRHLNTLDEAWADVFNHLDAYGQGKERAGSRQAGETVRSTLSEFMPLLADDKLSPEAMAELRKAEADFKRTGSTKLIQTLVKTTVVQARADERRLIEEEALKKARSEAGVLDKMLALKGVSVAPGSAANGISTGHEDRSIMAVTDRINDNTADDEDKRIWNERFNRKS